MKRIGITPTRVANVHDDASSSAIYERLKLNLYASTKLTAQNRSNVSKSKLKLATANKVIVALVVYLQNKSVLINGTLINFNDVMSRRRRNVCENMEINKSDTARFSIKICVYFRNFLLHKADSTTSELPITERMISTESRKIEK